MENFSIIEDAIKDFKEGKFLIVVDDEDRENEGDLIYAAETLTPAQMALLIRECSGIRIFGMRIKSIAFILKPN